MATSFTSTKVLTEKSDSPGKPANGRARLDVGLLTGGVDRPYALGLAMTLLSNDVRLDFIGSDECDSPELHDSPHLTFLNLRGNQKAGVSMVEKIKRVLTYYARLIRYASMAKPKVLHILWHNRFDYFDRTLLLLYYKLLGKKIVFTAHNVNAARRDSKDTLLNCVSLRIQYRLVDHIFVHTEDMKTELLRQFGVRAEAVTVIPFGINNAVPHTEITPAEAKRRLGIRDTEKTILFFGRMRQYKGLEYLVDSFRQIVERSPDYRLIIAGQIKRGSEEYIKEIQSTILSNGFEDRVIQKFQFIPDEDTELYFKAADVFALPYSDIFQSGVLFLGYSFGLPVVATDVGSMRDDIIESETGFLCKPRDSADLARAIETYFESDVYKTLDRRRQEIQDYANERHSWEVVGQMTRNVYLKLLGKQSA